MDAQINLLVGTVYVHRVFVVDQFFDHKGSYIKTHHVGLMNKLPQGCHLVVDVEIICAVQFVETFVDLFFQ
jgi:hypothetical protein